MGIKGSGGAAETATAAAAGGGGSVSNVRFRVPPVPLLLRLLSLFLSLKNEEEEEEVEDEEVVAVCTGFCGAPVATVDAAATMCCFRTARALLLLLPTEACLKWSCALPVIGFKDDGWSDETEG